MRLWGWSGSAASWSGQITDPREPVLRNLCQQPRLYGGFGERRRSGPEGIVFVPAEESPIGEPLLLVANELSGTTTVWRIEE
jgi:hypothetical protein